MLVQVAALTPELPVRITVSQPVASEFGSPLKGSCFSPGGLVQILRVTDGQIYP